VRLFVAINLPADERARLYRATADLRGGGHPARWVREAQLHLTMKFIGQVRDEEVPPIDTAVGKAAAAGRSFRLHLEGIGGFPSLRAPRVIWLGAEHTTAILSLHESLEVALEGVGVQSEDRAFRPHVTLARARRGARRSQWGGIEQLAAGVEFDTDLQVQSLDLMRSELNPRGARYTVLRAHTLAP
jgi:2'-5' RNA ligase